MEITSEKEFHAYGTKMRAVTEFKYLGRVLTHTDYDWPAVAGNIRKARASWGRLARILGQEGADLKVTRSFYTAVTQQVLLFGAESWVLTKRMESALDAFQGRVARRLTGRLPRLGRDGKWVYPPPWWAFSRRRGSRGPGHRSSGDRIWSRNSLRHNRFWGSARWRSGGGGHGSHINGGSIRA